MGNGGVTSGRSRVGKTSQHARESKISQLQAPRALVMGLVFGGLRVSAAASSAAQFGRVAQLANLGQQVTGLVQALEDERDETTGLLPITSAKDLKSWYAATDASATRVRGLAAGIGGSFPANIQSRVATMVST